MKRYVNSCENVAKSNYRGHSYGGLCLNFIIIGIEMITKIKVSKFISKLLTAMKGIFQKEKFPSDAVVIVRYNKNAVRYSQSLNTLYYRGYRESNGVIYKGKEAKWVVNLSNKSLHTRIIALQKKVEDALSI